MGERESRGDSLSCDSCTQSHSRTHVHACTLLATCSLASSSYTHSHTQADTHSLYKLRLEGLSIDCRLLGSALASGHGCRRVWHLGKSSQGNRRSAQGVSVASDYLMRARKWQHVHAPPDCWLVNSVDLRSFLRRATDVPCVLLPR